MSARQIREYQLHGGSAHLTMPAGSEIVAVVSKFDTVTMIVDAYPDNPRTSREFSLWRSDAAIPEGFMYIGTAVTSDGDVWHVFERIA